MVGGVRYAVRGQVIKARRDELEGCDPTGDHDPTRRDPLAIAEVEGEALRNTLQSRDLAFVEIAHGGPLHPQPVLDELTQRHGRHHRLSRGFRVARERQWSRRLDHVGRAHV